MNAKAKGSRFELKSKKLLQDDGWVVTKAGASIGAADLVALRAGSQPQMVQVKATAAGPYSSFTPIERAALRTTARRAGAAAVLHHWAPRAKHPKVLTADQWPA